MLASNEDGASWQLRTGTLSFFSFTAHHVVLTRPVALAHNAGGNEFFTLRRQSDIYTARRLQDDGFECLTFISLDQVRDAVCNSTTGGLFKRLPTKLFKSAR